jgi:hypothetical protein
MTKAVFITHPLFGPGPATPASPEWSQNWAAPALNFQRYMQMVAWAVKDKADGGAGVAVISWAHHWLIHTQGLIPEGRQGADLFVERDKALLRHADELWVGGGREAAPLSAGTTAMIDAALERDIPVYNCIAQGGSYVLTPWGP